MSIIQRLSHRLSDVSLRKKLLYAFILLFVTPLVATSLISFQIYKTSMTAKVSTSTLEVLRQTQNNVDSYLKQLDPMTTSIYFDQNMLQILREANTGTVSSDAKYYYGGLVYSYANYIKKKF